jgi:hypothetical protein
MEYRALIRLLDDVIQREASCASHHGIEDGEIKKCLVMGDEWSLNKAFNEALKVEIVNVAGRLSAKLWIVRIGSPKRTRLPSTKQPRTEWPYAGSVETSVTSENTVDRNVSRRPTRTWDKSQKVSE